jgi:hypothetical protein
MESTGKQIATPTRSWTGKVERRHPPKADYYSELRSWVHHAISEAEKSKDRNKKEQFLSLLKDL